MRSSMVEKRAGVRSPARCRRLVVIGLGLSLGAAACAHPVQGIATYADQAFGVPSVLDPDRAERDIASQFEDTFGVAAEVSCTQQMHVVAGAQYLCAGRTEDDEPMAIRVVITDAVSASYTWEVV
ncbi:protein of unknown function [Geodermatophilus dictyosporus]|uniref:DUF4333 domain-containing protein n=1 Tax=Geodermatophilus dictyosporus TaxID=1523247 RepID=A0A1I5U249_9ACTN|nr:protein of unknown function [Geodermatophilus dictyosporus]